MEEIFEIFTIDGWRSASWDTYRDYHGPKRWKYKDEDHYHVYGVVSDFDDED